jgi:pimeloyl-ACP methyl ester carboxylesterase
MPDFAHDGIKLHYRDSGAGEPLLLLNGLGFASWSWYLQTPAFEPSYRVIAIDNRGTGDSDKPPGPYSIAQMATDAVALLDHLDLGAAHVLGISMGGCIAQELALSHPPRVRSLTLGCTMHGGPRCIAPPAESLAAMRAEVEAGWHPDVLRGNLRLRFSAAFVAGNPAFFADHVALRSRHAPPLACWAAQAQAVTEFDSEPRLAQVRCPTLVITGDDDAIVPAGNARLLADRIAGARLVTLRGGHLFFMESAPEFNAAVLEFLRAT